MFSVIVLLFFCWTFQFFNENVEKMLHNALNVNLKTKALWRAYLSKCIKFGIFKFRVNMFQFQFQFQFQTLLYVCDMSASLKKHKLARVHNSNVKKKSGENPKQNHSCQKVSKLSRLTICAIIIIIAVIIIYIMDIEAMKRLFVDISLVSANIDDDDYTYKFNSNHPNSNTYDYYAKNFNLLDTNQLPRPDLVGINDIENEIHHAGDLKTKTKTKRNTNSNPSLLERIFNGGESFSNSDGIKVIPATNGNQNKTIGEIAQILEYIDPNTIDINSATIENLNKNNRNSHYTVINENTVLLNKYKNKNSKNDENENENENKNKQVTMKIPLRHRIYTKNQTIESLTQLSQTALDSMVYEQSLQIVPFNNSLHDDYEWGHIYEKHRVWCNVLTMWPERKENIEVCLIILIVDY